MKDYIKKHNDYVDQKIIEISIGIEARKGEDSSTITHKIISSILCGQKTGFSDFDAPCLDLHELLKRWPIEKDGDLAGYIYTQIQSKCAKNGKGQYFTPSDIVEKIVSQAIKRESYKSVRIYDPACGSGQFLICAFKRLLSFHLEDGNEALSASRHIIEKNLFGTDTDATALDICRYNLSLISGVTDKSKINLQKKDFLRKNSLYSTEDFWEESFDCVVGNPPWGSKISDEEKKYYKKEYSCAASGINTFTLFIERGMEVLKKQGKLAFLVPEAYLNIKAHEQSRKDILSSTVIESISLWGEQFKGVFAPSISIILIKDDSSNRDSNCIMVSGKEERERNTCRMVPQKHFGKMHHAIFNINYSGKTEFLLESVSSDNCIYLENNAKFFLGIVTGDNERLLSRLESEKHPDPIITGKDVLPFRIKETSRYFQFNPEKLQQTAPESFYRTKNKFLYKFIGSRLTFALDKEGLFSLNNVNGFIPSSLHLSDEAMLSLLNSSLIQYYYHNSFFTIKVLKGNLEKLPLKILSKESQNKLTNIVSDLQMDGSAEKYKQALENIDDIVFHGYGINDAKASQIYDEFNPTQITQSFIN